MAIEFVPLGDAGRQVGRQRRQLPVGAGRVGLPHPVVVLVLGQAALSEARLQHVDGTFPVRRGCAHGVVRPDLVAGLLDRISTRLDLISTRRDRVGTRDLVGTRRDLIASGGDLVAARRHLGLVRRAVPRVLGRPLRLVFCHRRLP